LVSRILERWQLGYIFSWSSGAPVTITASNAETTYTIVPGTINLARTANTPIILGDFAKSAGKVTTDPIILDANGTKLLSGGYYFTGYTVTTDPSISGVTGSQTLSSSFSNRALVDANGKIVLANPAPGTVGTLGRSYLEGPTHANFDLNIVKRIRVAEKKDFEIRVDVVNVLNNPRWSLLTGANDINSVNFGRLTAADPTGGVAQSDFTVANRRFTFSARLNF